MKKYPYHFLFIIIFFLTHGYAENIGLLSLKDLLTFFLICAALSSVVLLGFHFTFRNWVKAGIFISLLLLLYLFFGAILDGLERLGKIHYRFLLPTLIILLTFAAIIIRHTKNNLRRLNFYLNLVFIIFIMGDLVTIGLLSRGRNQRSTIHTTFQ